MLPLLLVAIGGALGAVARFLVGAFVARRFGGAFPLGTLVINVSGCFLIALFLGAMANHARLEESWRYLFPIGFVGAYTTFSTYEFELFRLFEMRQALVACAYFTASNALGFGAVALGAMWGRRL